MAEPGPKAAPPGRDTSRPESRKQSPEAPKPGPGQKPDSKNGRNATPVPLDQEHSATEATGDKDPKRPRLSRPPQTAEEKARRLADLYALLATAEDEATAKRHAGAIERLWMYSGSDTVGLLLDRAGKAMKKKKAELAIKLLDSVVALAPDYAEGFNQRAYFHFMQSNYDAAVGDLRRVIALDPNHYKALEGLAQIWRETGNKKGAFGVIKQLMDVYPLASGAKAMYEELKREVDGQGI